MAIPPYLVRDGDAWQLDVSVGAARERLGLSDRAENLLVEELEYEHRDLVPFAFVKALVLAGGAHIPETSPRALAWQLTGAGGGRTLRREDSEALAAYLESVAIADEAVETLREHVRACGVAAHLDGKLESRADRVSELSDIARDL